MAANAPQRRRRPIVGLAVALVLLLVPLASPVLAHHPADATDPRCDDWVQGNAPAGLDLTSICIAHEVVGAYTAAGTPSEPLLPYLGAALVAGMGLAVVGVVALRLAPRRVTARLSPEAPLAWWICASCRAVNAAGRFTCYACRADAPNPAAGDLMPTAAPPSPGTSAASR